MSDLNRARARAESFAHAVDDGPGHSPEPTEEPAGRTGLATEVELAGLLRRVGAVAPRPEFSADLRRRLVEQAAGRAPGNITGNDTGQAAGDDERVTALPPRRRRRIQLVASTAALVLLGGGIGSAAAAQQALPGDALYGMKRGLENVATSVGVSDESRGRRELDHALTRLTEVRALVRDGGEAAAVNDTLGDFSSQARQGVGRLIASYRDDPDPGALTVVTTFLTAAGQSVTELIPQLPRTSRPAGSAALATVDQLVQQTGAACPECAEPAGVGPTTRPTVTAPTADPRTTRSPTDRQSERTSADPSTAPPGRPSSPAGTTEPSAPPTKLTIRPSTRPSSRPPGAPTKPAPTVPAPTKPVPTLSLPLPTLTLPTVLPTIRPTLLPTRVPPLG